MARRSTALNMLWEEDTQSGENLQFELCKGGMFSSDDEFGLKVVGKTEQRPNNGKNLLKPPGMRTMSNMANGDNTKVRELSEDEYIVGITCNNYKYDWNVTSYSFENGIITIANTAESYGIGLPVACSANTTYTLSLDVLKGRCKTRVGFYDISGNYLSCYISDTKYNDRLYATGSNITCCEVRTYFITDSWSMISSDAIITKQQLESGDPTAYEPYYIGGIVSPSPDAPAAIHKVKIGTRVKCCGKNLLKITRTTHVQNGITMTANPDKSLTINGVCTGNIWIPITDTIIYPAGTYTLSGCPVGGSMGSYALYSDTSEPYIRDTGNGATVTITEPTAYRFWILIYHGQVYDNLTFYPQFEKSSASTNYEPYYDGDEVTVPCDLYEGDIYFPASGKVVRKNKTVTLNGTEYIILAAPQKPWMYYYNTTDLKPGSSENFYAYSSHFERGPDAWDRDVVGQIITNGRNVIFSYYSSAGLDGFKAFLAEKYAQGEPVKVVYKLETPVIEQYDPQPLSAPSGTVNVLQTPTQLTAELSATMLTKPGAVQQTIVLTYDESNEALSITGRGVSYNSETESLTVSAGNIIYDAAMESMTIEC